MGYLAVFVTQKMGSDAPKREKKWPMPFMASTPLFVKHCLITGFDDKPSSMDDPRVGKNRSLAPRQEAISRGVRELLVPK